MYAGLAQRRARRSRCRGLSREEVVVYFDCNTHECSIMYFGNRIVSIVTFIGNVGMAVAVFSSIDNTAIGRVHKAEPPWY